VSRDFALGDEPLQMRIENLDALVLERQRG
jgi:hypothetical protein